MRIWELLEKLERVPGVTYTLYRESTAWRFECKRTVGGYYIEIDVEGGSDGDCIAYFLDALRDKLRGAAAAARANMDHVIEVANEFDINLGGK